MVQLSLNEIRKSAHELTFKRGVQYHQGGHVKELHPKGHTIHAIVEGREPYRVTVSFDTHLGHLTYIDCDCPAFTKYSGACKHIVASLLEILYSKEKINSLLERMSYDSLIQSFQKSLHRPIHTQPQKEVHLEVIVEPLKEGITGLTFRMGVDKFYVLKDFHKFLIALRDQTPLSFGKGFVFDPNIHCFDPYSQKIMKLLEDYYDTFTFLKNDSGDTNSVQVYNSFYFPDNILKKLFSILKDREFTLKDRGVLGTSRINEDPLPLQFKMIEEDESIHLGFSQAYHFFHLTEDFEYVFFQGEIYHLNPIQMHYFEIVSKELDPSGQLIELEQYYKERALNAILPVFNILGEVTMNDTLKENVILEDLQPKLYLDKYRSSIKATLYFHYGDYQINGYSTLLTTPEEGQVIIRDIEKEAAIISLLRVSGFVHEANNEFLILCNEETLYDFIYTYLPQLQERMEVFYSSDFKGLEINVPKDVHGSIRLNNESNLLEFSFGIDDIDRKELPNILKAIQEKKKYYRLKDGSFLQLENEDLLSISEIITELHIKNKDLLNPVVELPKYRSFYIEQLLEKASLNNFENLIRNIKDPVEKNFELPDSLKNILRNYQKTGFYWLKQMSHYGFGGILADDMGLGKTLQTIALLKSIDPSMKSLVIAPTSLVYNWEDEIHKFAPDLKTCVITGNKNQRIQCFEAMKESQVIITSYGLLKRDLDIYLEYQFAYCFIDEAQHIKNPNSLNAKSVKMIKADSRFALTGTPIENSLTELWSIFDFIMPGFLLNHAKFMNTYEKPILKNEDSSVLLKLNNQIRPFILRRLKSDVLKELPPKIETKIPCELTEKQKKLYLAYLSKAKGEIEKEINAPRGARNNMKVLSVLTRLRQICCHPSLFMENYNGESGKLLLLEELVSDAIESRHRILIFSQFTSMLKQIQLMLDKNKITYFYLDGSIKPEDRRDMVQRFNSGEKEVFLISLKAGGTGLNLTGADTVIHYDPWWNPATEDQATDRAYRIGQNKSVQVMRLITAGTIEEKIYKLQEKKKSLIDSVIHPGETLISKLTTKELKSLFDIE